MFEPPGNEFLFWKRGKFIIGEGSVTGRKSCPHLAGHYGPDWPEITALPARYGDNLHRHIIISVPFGKYWTINWIIRIFEFVRRRSNCRNRTASSRCQRILFSAVVRVVWRNNNGHSNISTVFSDSHVVRRYRWYYFNSQVIRKSNDALPRFTYLVILGFILGCRRQYFPWNPRLEGVIVCIAAGLGGFFIIYLLSHNGVITKEEK